LIQLGALKFEPEQMDRVEAPIGFTIKRLPFPMKRARSQTAWAGGNLLLAACARLPLFHHGL